MFQLVALLVLFLVSQINGSDDSLVELGTENTFLLWNEVTLGDLSKSNSKVGFSIDGTLTVSSRYGSSEKRLLEFKLDAVKFSSIQKKGPKDEGVALGGNFAALIEGGEITKFYSDETKDVSVLNQMRGLASFFQFQYKDVKFDENDSSGNCFGLYQSKSSTKFTKSKTFCTNWDMRMNPKIEGPLGVHMDNFHEIHYDLTQGSRSLFKMESIEKHSVTLKAKEKVGSVVESVLTLKHLGGTKIDLQALDKFGAKYKEYSLESEIDSRSAANESKLKTFIKANKATFKDENVGKESLSAVIAKALPIARETTTQEFVEILKSPSMKNSQNLLIDLLGATQTEQSHKAFSKVFKFDEDNHFQAVERYLQAVSIGVSKPDDIIEDLLTKTDIKNEKLHFSLWQSIAALASRCHSDKLVERVNTKIIENLGGCEIIDCKLLYLQALQNIKLKTNIELLMDYVKNGETPESVAAVKALYALPVKYFTEKDKKALESTFYQKEKKFDSTARTLALDILLKTKPGKKEIQELINFLNSSCQQFEVKTYVLQKLKSLAMECPRFNQLLQNVLSSSPEINNYHVIAQKGLTTVLQRKLSEAPAYNESLLSVNEIKSGILKRGSVSLVLGRDYNTFELGLFTSGLSSYIGGNGDEESDNEETSAGMEISVQGVQFRPLVFFKGQGELMGHVWSGTASDRTPAYQATTIMQDSEHFIVLQNGGVTVNFKIFGARSIDLYGQVEFSLWNKNANTQISKDAGLTTVGTTTLFSSFFNLKNSFILTSEPKIKVQANIDFYKDILLCIQLGRPELILRYSNEKLFNFTPNTSAIKYSLKISNKSDIKLPGRTLMLNQKNNEMCNIIHGN